MRIVTGVAGVGPHHHGEETDHGDEDSEHEGGRSPKRFGVSLTGGAALPHLIAVVGLCGRHVGTLLGCEGRSLEGRRIPASRRRQWRCGAVMRVSRIHMCTTSRFVVVRIFLRADALGFRVHAGVNEEMTHFVSVISKVYRCPDSRTRRVRVLVRHWELPQPAVTTRAARAATTSLSPRRRALEVAEEAEVADDCLADGCRVLADTAGEDDRVDPAERGCHRRNSLRDAIGEDVERQPRRRLGRREQLGTSPVPARPRRPESCSSPSTRARRSQLRVGGDRAARLGQR